MKTIVETTRVLKKQSARLQAWDNGSLREIYFSNPALHGSPAKYFVRRRDENGDKRVTVVVGKVYQDDQGRPYFLRNS